jgi:hypothetical protein
MPPKRGGHVARMPKTHIHEYELIQEQNQKSTHLFNAKQTVTAK